MLAYNSIKKLFGAVCHTIRHFRFVSMFLFYGLLFILRVVQFLLLPSFFIKKKIIFLFSLRLRLWLKPKLSWYVFPLDHNSQWFHRSFRVHTDRCIRSPNYPKKDVDSIKMMKWKNENIIKSTDKHTAHIRPNIQIKIHFYVSMTKTTIHVCAYIF